MPNPGNAGDSLIALGAYTLFDQLKIEVEIGDYNSSYPDRTVVYGGGGSLIDNYPEASDFICRNHPICKTFVLLPSTVRSFEDMISDMGDNCHLFAREKKTFEYLKTHRTDAQVTLSHDLAFLVDNPLISQAHWDRNFVFSDGRWRSWFKMAVKFAIRGRFFDQTLSALRIDSEATNITRPHRNHDLSHYFTTREMHIGQMDPEVCATTIKMMHLLMRQYGKIRTNRLHLSILGAIAGMQVEMLPNSYDKNASIFEHSIANIFPNVAFMPINANGGERKNKRK